MVNIAAHTDDPSCVTQEECACHRSEVHERLSTRTSPVVEPTTITTITTLSLQAALPLPQGREVLDGNRPC